MRAFKQVKSVVVMLAMAFVMTLACSAVVKAAPAAPAKVTGVRQTAGDKDSLKLEWTAQLTNPTYKVELSTDKVTWVEKEDATSSNYAYISNLNSGTTYYARVTAYEEENGVYAYGVPSDAIECITAPNSEPKNIKKIACTTTSVTLTWDAVPGANYYQVLYGNDYAQVLYTTTNKITITKLAKNSSNDIKVYALRKSAATGYVTNGYYFNYETISNCKVTPAKVTGVDVDYYWFYLNEISVIYTSSDAADGYQTEVWTAYKNKDTKVKTVNTTWSNPDVKSTQFGKYRFFKVRVRAYTTLASGKKVYGAWSKWKYVCPEPRIRLTSTKKGMNVKFEKVAGADRYDVYVSNRQKSGYKKAGSTKKASFTVTKYGKKKLKKGKTYYFYVVAYNKVGKKYVSGEAGNANTCWYKKY